MADHKQAFVSLPDPAISIWMYVPVAVSLIVGLTLSLLAFTAVWQDETQEMQKAFTGAAIERVSAINQEMKQNLQFLDYLKAFYKGSEKVEQGEFKEFVDLGMENLNSFQIVGWAPRVSAAVRKQFEATRPMPNYKIYHIPEPNQRLPAPEKEEYYPVEFLEPFEGRERILGYDLSSLGQVMSGLLNHARDTGKITATNWVQLGAALGATYGVYFYQPIYNKTDTPLTNVQQRRGNLKGFVFGIYRINDIIVTALEYLEKQEIDISISNYSKYLNQRTTYDYRTQSFEQTEVLSNITPEEALAEMLEEPSPLPPEKLSAEFLTYEQTLDFFGRRWDIICKASDAYINQHRTWHPWGVLVLGLMVTALVTAYCIASIGQLSRIERLVQQRTAELKKANEQLETGIFERQRAEEAVEKLNRELAEKNRELESIIYATSHDFRSPLLNIKGFSTELTEACTALRSILSAGSQEKPPAPKMTALLEKEIPQALQYIQAGVDKMDKLLAGILQLSRLGQTVLTVELLDMNKMMAQIIESMEFQIKQAGAALEVGNLPACLGDENQINQVFSNLLDNALKYLDKNRPGVINISGRIEPGGRALYCVKDNGVGIAPEQKEMIFELFYRLDQTTKPLGEGLGLTIARRIINRHNGKIWVESKLSEGSEFWVSLPTKGN